MSMVGVLAHPQSIGMCSELVSVFEALFIWNFWKIEGVAARLAVRTCYKYAHWTELTLERICLGNDPSQFLLVGEL